MYKKVIKIGSMILMLFLIIYLGTLIDWFFRPLIVFFQTLFLPMILAGVLYYLSRPVVRVLSIKMPRTVAIIMLYIGFITIVAGFISFIVPELHKQLNSLVNRMPMIIADIKLLLLQMQENQLVQRLDLTELFNWEEQVEQLGAILGTAANHIVANTVGVISAVFNVLILLFIVPFILFYLLKDGEKFPKNILRFIRKEKQEDVRLIFHNMDQTLSNYIQGVLMVCSFVGIVCYLAFSIIGLEFALVLALFAMITNVIPYVGPWIGAVPAVIVAFLHSPLQALFVVSSVVVIQQVESILVQPQVMGRKMAIHPVTVLFLVLVAGRFIGIIGMVLAIPTYAVAKVIVIHLYRLWKLKQKEDQMNGT